MSCCYIGLNKIYIMEYNKRNGVLPIIFIHGAGATGSLWEYITYKKFDGFYQIVIDLPGHGKSPGDGFRSIEGYADFIESVVIELGLKDFVLAGHSMGGAIGLQYALKFQSKLRGLILISTGAKFIIPIEMLQLVKNNGIFYEHAYSKVTPFNIIKKIETEYYKTHYMVRYNDLLACNNFNIIDKLYRISVKTCIMCGENDVITPPEYSKHLHKNIKNSQLILLEKAGHMVLWDQPEQVSKVITKFLKVL